MMIVLMAIGLLVAAAGFVTIGFGIPINAFSLGNTLIIAGTVAVSGGLVLIALAVLIGQLRRIAETLKDHPGLLTDRIESRLSPVTTIASVAANASSRTEPAPEVETPAVEEPRPAVAAAQASGPLDWLRSKSRTIGGSTTTPSEAPVVEVADEAPLSPKPPHRPAMSPAMENSFEPKLWSPSRPGGPLEPRVGPRVEQPMPRANPQAESPKERERFDLVWPDRSVPSPTPQPGEPAKREPTLEMPLPPIPARPRDARASERRVESVMPKPTPERGPAILKSGVIDGMPYTLYADGSIEAELPTGTVKFASVDALRAHLESQS
jgi:hypothetical protein